MSDEKEHTVGFLDHLLGREAQEPQRQYAMAQHPRGQGASARTDDEIAVERYQYLLRTAPPETIEQVHTEAFGKLTVEQREQLFRQLSENANSSERPVDSEPATLAQAATRAELRQPGALAGTFGNQGRGGMGFGSMVGSSLLGTVAGFVIGSALVSAFMPMDGGATDAASESDASADASADAGAGADSDAGGDFGGGDFGGGDFGL